MKIINSPFWTVNPEFCDNVTIKGITIDNAPSPNTDGVNPESCRNVHISDCHISVGDDCITIKSGRDAQPAVEETEYLRHVHFDAPITIKMDGKKSLGVVLKP